MCPLGTTSRRNHAAPKDARICEVMRHFTTLTFVALYETHQVAPRPPMALSSSGQAPQARGLTSGPMATSWRARTFVRPSEHPEPGWPGVTRVFAGSCGRRGGWSRAQHQWGTGRSAHVQTYIYIPVAPVHVHAVRRYIHPAQHGLCGNGHILQRAALVLAAAELLCLLPLPFFPSWCSGRPRAECSAIATSPHLAQEGSPSVICLILPDLGCQGKNGNGDPPRPPSNAPNHHRAGPRRAVVLGRTQEGGAIQPAARSASGQVHKYTQLSLAVSRPFSLAAESLRSVILSLLLLLLLPGDEKEKKKRKKKKKTNKRERGKKSTVDEAGPVPPPSPITTPLPPPSSYLLLLFLLSHSRFQ